MSLSGRYDHLFLLSATILIMSLGFAMPSHARFLTDDLPASPPQNQTAPESVKTQTPDASMPADIAHNITAILLSGEKNSVQITWDAPSTSMDSFVVLRSSYAISSADMLANAIPVKVVPGDKLKMVIDRNLLPGRYYYAVLSKSKMDLHAIQFFASENFTLNPIIISNEHADNGNTRTVSSLKAITVDDRTVLLSWEPLTNFTGEYVIFRSNTMIDTTDRLSQSEPAARITSPRTKYLDNDAGPGRHYYAVACKTVDGVLYSDLRKDANFISDPVFVGGVIGVRAIRAQKEGSDVVITWKSNADTISRNYYLLRTRTAPAGKDSIAGSYILDTVQSAAEKYTDRNVPAGRYYYILAPSNYKDDEDFTLTRSVNVTDPAIVIANGRDKIQPEQSDEAAGSTGGQSSSTAIALRQPEQALQHLNLSDDDILARLEEIPLADSQSFRTGRIPEPLPPDTISEKSLPAVSIHQQGTAGTSKSSVDADAEISQPQREIHIGPIHSSAVKEPDETVEPQRQTHAVRQKKKQSIEEPESSHVDEILDRLYKQGAYKQTITELSRMLPRLQGKQSAAALYYIGRSCVELKRYRDAVRYFSNTDVRKYFPRESSFWRDYSLEQMR